MLIEDDPSCRVIRLAGKAYASDHFPLLCAQGLTLHPYIFGQAYKSHPFCVCLLQHCHGLSHSTLLLSKYKGRLSRLATWLRHHVYILYFNSLSEAHQIRESSPEAESGGCLNSDIQSAGPGVGSQAHGLLHVLNREPDQTGLGTISELVTPGTRATF